LWAEASFAAAGVLPIGENAMASAASRGTNDFI
jgi:hypothetical protein